MYIPALDAAYQECMQLYRTSSTTSRIKKLQAIADSAGIWREVFLCALRYAYDPYKRYHVTRGTVRGSGTDVLGLDPFILLDKLSMREISGNAAPYAVSQMCQRLTPVSAEMFKRILLKDLRIGLGAASINKAFPGLVPEHKVMLAKPLEWHRVKYPCVSTVKLDGVRAIYRAGVFYTRNGKILQGLETLAERLSGAPVLDGELVCPGMDFQTSSGSLRSFAETPNAQFHIIDLPEHPARLFGERMLGASSLKDPDGLVCIIPWRLVRSMEEVEQHYQACLEAGYEGVVVKPMEYEYVNKRSFDWMKLKAINTVDARIVDIFEGTGKYSSSAGGVIIQMPDSEVLVRVGSGFSDEQRDEIYAAPDDYIGRMIEVKYHEVTPDGSLRHPRFYRWRDDK